MEDLGREGSSYGFLYADGSVAAGACLDAFEGVVGLYEVHVLGDEGCLLLDGGGGTMICCCLPLIYSWLRFISDR